MENYPWPGNVRQMLNVIERATIMADGNEITLDDLPPEISTGLPDAGSPGEPCLTSTSEKPRGDAPASEGDVMTLEEFTRRHVQKTLDAFEGNKSKASASLGHPPKEAVSIAGTLRRN